MNYKSDVVRNEHHLIEISKSELADLVREAMAKKGVDVAIPMHATVDMLGGDEDEDRLRIIWTTR